ncbi:response regulator transcription factor [Alteraurantiacibacter aestuarii]|uniref:response regulator transcription factor n=1 Tax=Alteraurantiacibacter aestuarii TaxID=650004 RepID=UPI00301D9A2C
MHIVDDDEMVRRSLAFMLASEGLQTTQHDSAASFLAALPELEEGCLLLDLRLGDANGIDLQRRLHENGSVMPVVIMTGQADVSSAVAAMKEGAVDFLEKPFSKADLLTALRSACERLAREQKGDIERDNARHLMEQLSPRERQVLKGLARGKANKNIAFDLGISPRTVEIHRSNAMRKLNVRSLPELLHLAFRAGEMDD